MKTLQALFLLAMMLTALGGSARPAGPQGGGTICVLPNPAEPPTRISPGGEYDPATPILRIDQQKAVPWPHKETVLNFGAEIETRICE